MIAARQLSDVTLACKDESVTPAHGTIVGRSSNEMKIKEPNIIDKKPEAVKTDEISSDYNKVEEVNKLKVNYSLNKVKNLEVAKSNAERPIKISRFVTDDQNIRYEMNSGQYLHIKEEMIQYTKGQSEFSDNGEVTISVEKNSAVEDSNQNNPETQIKMTVTNNKINETTKVVIKLYHTNQSIHLKGGKRMGENDFNIAVGRLSGETLDEKHGDKYRLDQGSEYEAYNYGCKGWHGNQSTHKHWRPNSSV